MASLEAVAGSVVARCVRRGFGNALLLKYCHFPLFKTNTPYPTLGLADGTKSIKLCPFLKGFGQPLAI